MLQRDTTVGTVFLDDASEKRLNAQVRRCGGRVITTGENTAAEAVTGALEAVERTLAVLELLLEPEPDNLIRDVVPRA